MAQTSGGESLPLIIFLKLVLIRFLILIPDNVHDHNKPPLLGVGMYF